MHVCLVYPIHCPASCRTNNQYDIIDIPPTHTHIQVFTSLHDALQWGKFDAAVVMVPHHLHETCAVQCLAAGKHVLLEKPLAHTLDSCSRLLEAAKCSNRVFMVGENSQHWPEVELLDCYFDL